MWGNNYSYTKISWAGATLEDVSKTKNGVALLQNRVNGIKGKLKVGERILCPEHLESLGVKI
jgi:hypothetical protein